MIRCLLLSYFGGLSMTTGGFRLFCAPQAVRAPVARSPSLTLTILVH